jgi:chromosome segregation ATPase
MKKYFFPIFAVLGLSSIIMGCSGFSKDVIKIQKDQAEHLTLIDKRIKEYDQILPALESSVRNFERHLSELSQETITMLDKLDSRVEKKNKSLEEVRENIRVLEKKLNNLQESNKNLQNQITKLQSQISEIPKKNFELFF